MVTTVIVGVVALVVGAVAGILFTNNNVKKVQATLDYFESLYNDATDDLVEAWDSLERKNKQITELTKATVVPAAKTTKAKKAAS